MKPRFDFRGYQSPIISFVDKCGAYVFRIDTGPGGERQPLADDL